MTAVWADRIKHFSVGTCDGRRSGLQRVCLIVIVAMLSLGDKCSQSPQSGPQARAIDAMCVLHADARAPNVISLNHKVFEARRDSTTSSTGFGNFQMVPGPFGDGSLTITNLDSLPSVYAISDTWFRGVSFNESVRAEVVPALRTDSNGQSLPGEPGIGTGARWFTVAQDFTGAWKAVSQASRNSANARDELAANDSNTVAQIPQWMHIGVATPQLFFCAGARTNDGAQSTTELFDYTPAGTSPGAAPAIMDIQDVLNGDDRFRPDPPPAPPLGGNRIAAPVPNISGPAGNLIPNGIVQCAMTQDGDDVTTRTLHLVAVRGPQLLHAMLSNFGPVAQALSNGTTSTFSRFRTVSPWREITQSFPAINFGGLDHVAVAATGRDNLLHIFFVGHGNDGRYRLWHTKRFANDSFSNPVDVLKDSGETVTGTPYDMPVTASFCPARGNRSPTFAELDDEILLTWFNSDLRSIVVQEVVHTPRSWVTGRADSVYSQLMVVQPDGLEIKDKQGRDAGTSVLRTRISLRPFSDTPP